MSGSTDARAGSHALRGRRILVVGSFYHPELTGIAPYTTRMAEDLATAGASVSALVPMPSYPRWRVFDGYRGRRELRERIGGVDVRRIWCHVPARPGVTGRGLMDATFAAHASLLRPGRFDAVVAVTPNLSAAAAGAWFARRNRCPLMIVVQDLTGLAAAQAGIPSGGAVQGIVRRVEGALLRAADAVAIVSPAFREFLHQSGVRPEAVHEIRNWSHIREPDFDRVSAVRARFGWNEGDSVVLHAGNMGYKQGLENVVEAARIAAERALPVRFVLMGDGNQRTVLEQAARGLPTLAFIPSQPDESFPETLAAADVLLVNERTTVREMSLPSKLTSYFAARRPIVVAAHADGATAAELARAHAGLRVDPGEPGALIDAVLALRRDPAAAARYGEAGARYRAEHLMPEAALERIRDLVARLAA